jgi:hypothetical protein
MAIARRIHTEIAVPGELPFESNIIGRDVETRPDWRTPAAGDPVYVLRDLWPQVNGSADSWPQWARDAYLKPWGDPCNNDSAGGDTHLFAVALRAGDACGAEQVKSFIAWTGGFDKLGDPSYTGYVGRTADRSHGWVNWFDPNGYYPDQSQRGPWCWCPWGWADVVDGGGLPYNRHVSWFGVWEKMTYGAYLTEKGGAPERGVVPPLAERLAIALATRLRRTAEVGSDVTYQYMPPDQIVALAVAIERGLVAAYEEEADG